MTRAASHKQYLWGLDLIRFAAALLVAFFHLTWFLDEGNTIAWYGWVGVQIFFVISGLVIAQSANSATPLGFVRSRMLRLYPSAWICAIIGLGVTQLVNHATTQLPQRFFNSFFLSPVGPFLTSAYWTLPVELAFYALVFAVLLVGIFERLQTLAMWLCVASATYNVAYALHCADVINVPELEFGYDWKNLTLLRHGIYFGIGIFVWLWSERRLAITGWIGLTVALTAAPLEIACRAAEVLARMPGPGPSLAGWLVPLAVWAVALATIAASAKWEHLLGVSSPHFRTSTRVAGLATYPLYLMHESVGEAGRNYLHKLGLGYLSSVCLAIAATTVLAAAIAYVGEPGLRRLMRGWFDIAAAAAERAPRLQRLLRPGGTI